jgi:HAD superfamily hydrolase (TIGR01509 family)
VIDRMVAHYRLHVPLLPGASSAVEAAAARGPVAVASGSDRVLLDTVAESSGLARLFTATVASDEVTDGKPAPLIYLTACALLGVEPARSVAVEDSGAGIESALAAGMAVVAVPRPGFEPSPSVLARAGAVLPDLLGLDDLLTSGSLRSG